MKQWLPVLFSLILIFAVGFLIWQGIRHSTQPGGQVVKPSAPLPKEVVVQLTKDGFSPKDVKIKMVVNKAKSEQVLR